MKALVHKVIIGVVGFLGVLALIVPLYTFAEVTGVPFGGRVLATFPCNTGLLVLIQGAYPPGVIPIMWLTGELPFLDHIPPHIGQELLGVLAPAPVPCFLAHIPIGVGLPIEFHGDSI